MDGLAAEPWGNAAVSAALLWDVISVRISPSHVQATLASLLCRARVHGEIVQVLYLVSMRFVSKKGSFFRKINKCCHFCIAKCLPFDTTYLL